MVPAGTAVNVRLSQAIDVDVSQAGQTFKAVVDDPVMIGGSTVIPRGASAIVQATTFHDDADVLAKISRGLGEAMVGINVEQLPVGHRLAERGW